MRWREVTLSPLAAAIRTPESEPPIAAGDPGQAVLRPEAFGSDGVRGVEGTAVRYRSESGAAEGFALNVQTVQSVLPHFERVDAPPLGAEAVAWRYELDDQTGPARDTRSCSGSGTTCSM